MSARDRYLILLDKMRIGSSEPDDFAFLNKRMVMLGEYVLSVYTMQIGMSVVYDEFSGEDIPDTITGYDGTRKRKHDAAIDAVRQLNRLCEAYNTDILFTGNMDDRQEVAEFCMELVKEFFDNRNKNRR